MTMSFRRMLPYTYQFFK